MVDFVELDTPVEEDQEIADEVNADLDGEAPERGSVVDSQEEFYANLVGEIPEAQRLGQLLMDAVSRDLSGRKEWERKEADGIEALGLGPNKTDRGYDTMTDAAAPTILTACLQLHARGMKELWPPNKPAKVKRTPGAGRAVDPSLEESRDRREAHVNHQLLVEDNTGYREDSSMLMYLSFRGSGFKFLYHDGTTVRSEFVRGRDMIVPYQASDLARVTRFARDCELDYRTLREMVEDGAITEEFFEGLPTYGDDSSKENAPEIRRAEDDQQGIEDQGIGGTDLKEGSTFGFYKIYAYVDCGEYGFEDALVGGSKVPSPYVVLVHKESHKVGSVIRDWDAEDPKRVRDLRYVDYELVSNPFGFYGLGYFHLLGNLDSAMTAILNAVVDGGIRASNQGGFMSSQLGQKGATVPVTPGVYESLDIPVDDLGKGFYTPDFKQPSPVLFSVMGFLSQAAQGVGAATEMITGQGDNKGPVGTTLALIEQGLEVYSEIFRRLHDAKKRELEIRAKLNRRFIPEDGYPFIPHNEDEELVVYQKDYAETRIVPVSDPQASSPQLRIAKAEALLQLSERSPGLYDAYAVHMRMLQALQVDGIDEVLINPEQAMTADQVTENVLMALGRPVRVAPWQDHEAHIATIQAFRASEEGAQLPEPQQMALQMHELEHVLYRYRQRIQMEIQGAGADLEPLNIYGRRADEVLSEPMDPELENQMAPLLAQLAQQHAEENPAPPEPEDEVDAELRRKQELHEQQMAHGDEAFKQDMTHKEAEHKADLVRKMQEAGDKARDIMRKELEL